MKIIHCSDLHLDSRMETNLPVEKALLRNNEIVNTFSRMAAYAQENQVRAVLICGDLFDTRRVTGKTADLVLSAIARASGVDFLYLRGNHDESERAFAGRALPENLKLFSEGWRSYRYGSVVIAGAELSRDNAADIYSGLSLSAEDTNIVMLHGQISNQRGDGLVCLPMLREKNIHYLALGHLHSYQEGRLDLTGRYAYSGCLEGRGFDECGEKGFVLLDAGDRRVSAQFVPFASRQLYDIPVDISGLRTISQIRDAMERAGAGVDARHLVKYTLRGTYTLETQKDLPYLLKSVEPEFFFVKIRDESRLAMDSGNYEHDISLKGEFIRMVMASDKSPEEKEKIICMGIQALSGEAVIL